MESRVGGLIEQLHSITDKAVAVGFGVSGPEQVTLMSSCFDINPEGNQASH